MLARPQCVAGLNMNTAYSLFLLFSVNSESTPSALWTFNYIVVKCSPDNISPRWCRFLQPQLAAPFFLLSPNKNLNEFFKL